MKVIATNKISDLKRNDEKQDNKKKVYENVDNHINIPCKSMTSGKMRRV